MNLLNLNKHKHPINLQINGMSTTLEKKINMQYDYIYLKINLK